MSDVWHTHTTPLMGTTLNLAGGAAHLSESQVRERFAAVVDDLQALAAVWTRFDPASDLEQLNASRQESVRVDPRLGRAVAAALACRRRSRGLVDPALGDAIADVGYDETISTLDRVDPVDVARLVARRPCRPAQPRRRCAPVAVSPDLRTVTRRPGVRLDLGGTAKGLAVDIGMRRLRDLDRWTIDLGGDVRVGGARRDLRQEVLVAGPVDGATVACLAIDRGAVATSAITRRAWRGRDGEIAHHLLDPSAGRSAWTGLLQVTARARTALEAELLAKVALLRGPQAGVDVLRGRHGGVLVHADGTVQEVHA